MKFYSLILLSIILVGVQNVFAQGKFDHEVDSIVELSSSKGFDSPIIFIGSSSIRFWRTLESDFAGINVLNHGFGGSQFKDILRYQDQLIERFEPGMLVIYSGDNDIAEGKDPETVAEAADRLVDGFSRYAREGLVIILSVKPSPARWEFKDQYIDLNERLKTVADSYDHVVFLDIWTPMIGKVGEPNTKLFLDDGLHMNEKGYAIWKNALRPYIYK